VVAGQCLRRRSLRSPSSSFRVASPKGWELDPASQGHQSPELDDSGPPPERTLSGRRDDPIDLGQSRVAGLHEASAPTSSRSSAMRITSSQAFACGRSSHRSSLQLGSGSVSSPQGSWDR